MKNPFKSAFVCTAFFLSGGCGLVYEVLWIRYLADLTGGTALSQLIVLMVFMGGLALGALIVGRIVDKGADGLLIYGALEFAIGLYAVLFPQLFAVLARFYYSVGVNLGNGSTSLLFLKILLALLLIVAPSVAMGGTLPAVIRYLTKSHKGLRGNISLLYGINSLGAVVGILAGGFFLVYRFGMAGSMQYTGVFNLVLGLAALAYARFGTPDKAIESEENRSYGQRLGEKLDCRTYEPAEVRAALIAAALSGFAAMALQVAWIRYFVIVLGATHSSFTIVVAAFIFGIGLGSLLVRSRLIARIPLPTVLVGLMALVSLTLGAGLFFYARVPFEISRLLSVIARTPYAWPYYVALKFGSCFALMLLPTLASGMILPICVRIAERGNDRLGSDVAKVYAVNTIGALLGILVAGQLLFRVFTLPRTLQVILLIYLAATIFLAFVLDEKGRKRILAVIVVMVAVHFAFWRPWSPEELFVSRINFGTDPPLNYNWFAESNKSRIVVEDRQGPDVQVTILENSTENRSYKNLTINGKPDASDDLTGPDAATQVLLAHLPLMLHPEPKNVFVFGLGSGITSGEVLKFPELKEVTTVELAREVFEASKVFAESNGRFWENPKHRMVIGDGKTFLQLSKEKFDVITMEPTNVWQEGMAGLFSEEFFRIVKSKMAAGGIVAQWMHLYAVDDLTLNIVLKTFSRVFPKTSVFMMTDADILLVGYEDQWQFSPQIMKRRFYHPEILAKEKQIGNVSPVELLLQEVMSRNVFSDYTAVLSAPVNTIDNQILEKVSEYALFIDKRVSVFDEYDSRLDPDGGDLLIHEYAKLVGFDLDQKRAVIDSGLVGQNDKLEQSLNFMLLDELWAEDQASPPREALAHIYDPQLREIISHPYYRRELEQLTGDDAFNLFGAELIVWDKAASQLWTPDPQRLHQLYDRLSARIDRQNGGKVARNAALFLARGRACGEALHFYRIADAKGQLDPAMLQPDEIAAVFSCETKEGEAAKALRWWREIEQRQMGVTAAMQRDKITLDIKLGGDPPPPVYALPSLW
jgi:spermidine synthase/MFS family permease